MLIGLGIGLPFASAISLAAQIAALFAAGEQGVWYDPADFSTMFQDSAGTTPVTAAGQPVGLMLDKSKGLVLGPELVTNGTFDTDTVGYATYQATLAAVAGEMQITSAAADLSQSALMGLPVTTGKWYEVSATLRRGTNPGTVTLEVYDGVAQVLIAEVASIAGVTVSGTVQAKAMLIDVKMNCHTTAIGQTSFVDNISVRELPGNHATQPTAINRPVLQQDGNGKYYLAFNGTNSWMSTGSIDFTATDKMTVVAGVRKLSDAAESIVFELSANTFLNSGAFNLMAPGGLSVARDSAYVLSAGGSSATANGPAAALYAAPTTGVITELLSISLDTAILRVNGAQASSSVTDQGTGNFGNYPLYIGARAGSSLFFNGNIYELIVRGALSSDSQIVASEKFVNTKTGAY